MRVVRAVPVLLDRVEASTRTCRRLRRLAVRDAGRGEDEVLVAQAGRKVVGGDDGLDLLWICASVRQTCSWRRPWYRAHSSGTRFAGKARVSRVRPPEHHRVGDELLHAFGHVVVLRVDRELVRSEEAVVRDVGEVLRDRRLIALRQRVTGRHPEDCEHATGVEHRTAVVRHLRRSDRLRTAHGRGRVRRGGRRRHQRECRDHERARSTARVARSPNPSSPLPFDPLSARQQCPRFDDARPPRSPGSYAIFACFLFVA